MVRTTFAALLNAIDYPLRRFFRWRRSGLRIRNEPKTGLFASLPAADRPRAEALEAGLSERYDIAALYANSTRGNYRENLYYLEMLDQALEATGADLPDRLVAADIGPSHWFYVQALLALLRGWRSPESRQVTITAYEADAYRVYTDLHSRMDHALAHARGAPELTYLPQPFSAQPGAFGLITMLFPFVFLPDHLEWGLPNPHFEPARLLAAAWDSLAPGGLLIIANQGEKEHQAQRALLEQAGIRPAAAFRFESLLFQYDLPRFVFTARRDG